MPGLDGLEVCRRIRGCEAGRDTFVLILTARDGRDDLLMALGAGADDYMTKPATPEHLRARLTIAATRIEQNTARRRAEEALARARWLAGIGETAIALQHEINNPLTALLTYAELLGADAAVPAEQRSAAAAIAEQARRIAAVVKRLAAMDDPRSVEYLAGARMLDLSGKR
jgi:CheY-like chemotaxis protein